MIRTSRRLLAVAGIAALTVSGCGTGTLRAGAAAVVGPDRITTSTVRDVVARGLVDPQAQQSVGADRTAFERSVLGRLIDHVLVVKAAEKVGVSVSGAEIDGAQDRIAQQLGGAEALKAEAAKAGIAPSDLRQTIADIALRDNLGDRLTASIDVPDMALRAAYQQGIAMYDKVDSAHILVATQTEAASILAKVQKDPTQFAALAAQFSQDTSNKAKGGELGFQGRGALEKPFENAIFDNKPGSFVIAKTRFGFHVIKVIARQTVTFEQAKGDLRRGLLGQQRTTAVQALLQRTAKDLGVSVNPRFGAWDATSLAVIAPTADPAKDVTRTSPSAPALGNAPGAGQGPTGP